MEWTEKHTPYEALGLEPGQETTDAIIKKAYRQLAIKKHPDKNPNNPNAAAEFAELERAYRILLDSKARGALDDFLQAKAARTARDSQASDKRRKMKEALAKKEQASVAERTEEEVARMRLKVELDRLRRMAAEEAATQHAQAAAVTAAVAAARAVAAAATSGRADAARPSDGGNTPSDATQAQLKRTLKVSWDPETGRDYSQEDLRSALGVHGTVEDVVVREKRKRHKSSALVVMATEEAAHAAATSLSGDAKDPLLVTLLLKVAPRSPDQGMGSVLNNGQNVGSAVPAVSGVTGRWRDAHGAANGHGSWPDSHRHATAVRMPTVPAKPLFPFAIPPAVTAPETAINDGNSIGSEGRGVMPPSLFTAPRPLFPTASSAVAGSSGSSFPLGSSSFPTSSSSFPSGGFGSFKGMPGGGAKAGGSSSAEDAILEKMRRASEREKQLAEARRAAAAENAAADAG